MDVVKSFVNVVTRASIRSNDSLKDPMMLLDNDTALSQLSTDLVNLTDFLTELVLARDLNLTSFFLKGGVLLFIILLTITGNLLVLIAVLFHPNLRTATNCFIVNLALADLLLGASVLPFSATLELLNKQWFFGKIFCNIWAATDVLCCTASINSLCVISVDRYIGVTRPLTYSSIVTHKRAVIACILVWVLSFVISVGPLFGWRDPPPANPHVCEVTKQAGYVIFSVVFSFYIPTFIILVVYQRIYCAAARQTKFLETGVKIVKAGSNFGSGAAENGEQLTLRVHAGPNQNGLHHRNGHNNTRVVTMGLQGRLAKFKRQKKAAKTLGIVVGVYFICWFPFFFLLPLGTLCERCTIPPLLFDICFWTGYFNSCLNPFIYASTSREYKRAFRAVLKCQWSWRCSRDCTDHSMHWSTTNNKTVTYTIRSESALFRRNVSNQSLRNCSRYSSKQPSLKSCAS